MSCKSVTLVISCAILFIANRIDERNVMIFTNEFDSMAIDTASYDTDTSNLTIMFTSSPSQYTYVNVPFDVFKGLVEAKSAGVFFNHVIKPSYATA